ncbi:MAG TPA: alpha/beta fold hydrolase [Candidatus Dormibacteraeota bacterium]|nr:alpha/beta fold hydrolase [Candidatus Dormibacteraeota bacterium]
MSITHGQRIVEAGASLEGAHAAMVLVHGRGASAEDIMTTVASEVQVPRWTYLAPQATGNAWYPNPFTAPMESNEPHFSAGLEMLARIIERVEASVPAHRIVLLGFSQGACLTLEFAARNARRLGGVVGLSGGLMGPDGTPRDYPGSFEGTPVLLGCSDVDPYIGKDRVAEAAAVMARMGAEVDMRLYPGMGHMVGEDEIARLKELVGSV